jgi:hypothetical protein
LPLTAVPRAALVLAIGLIATPAFAPISPSDRARLASMHERQVAWLRSGKARHLRFWSSSISAAIDAGERTVPRDVLSSAVELELAKQPAVTWFTQRVERGVYDGLALQSSVLFDTQSFGKLRAALASGFRVAGPPELGGHWPKDRTGYVLLERSAPTR